MLGCLLGGELVDDANFLALMGGICLALKAEVGAREAEREAERELAEEEAGRRVDARRRVEAAKAKAEEEERAAEEEEREAQRLLRGPRSREDEAIGSPRAAKRARRAELRQRERAAQAAIKAALQADPNRLFL